MAGQYPTNAVIAGRIVTRRNAQGITQQQLAKLTGIPRSRLSDYETDRRDLTVADALKIAEQIGTSLQTLTEQGLLL
ncbi:MAG: helix-turn-helix domain-containing protein [Planctomycetota bacterium]|jgi:transcriptional regulator with XRE-family HTH domain